MRPRLLVPVVLCVALVGCGDDGEPEAAPSTEQATSTTEDVGAYCRLMERTDAAYTGEVTAAALAEQVRAEQQRISEAPAELRDEYARFAEGSVPNEVIERIQDWTQEHCGFLPSFG